MSRFYLADEIEPKPPGPGWDAYMRGTHDGVRDRIAAKFLLLPDFTCGFCGTLISFPTEDISSVETEYTYSSQPRLRADVAALAAMDEVAAVVEVILTSTPSDEALAAHEGLPFVAYVEMNQRAVYCSRFCWTYQGQENLCPWSVPRCEKCRRPFHQTFSKTVWGDWADDPNCELCLECAAGIPGAQWPAPGEVIGGMEAPGPDATIADRFLAFTNAEFWAMVWEGRANYPSEPYGIPKDESATASRLDQVESAFDAGHWDKGFQLLQPIGAPGWGAVEPDESAVCLGAGELRPCQRRMDSAEGSQADGAARRNRRHHKAQGFQAGQLCGG